MPVKKLTETADLERYVEFAGDVYRENSYWVPPDKHHLMALLGGNSGFGPQSKIQSFAVEDGNRILATVAAFTDEAYNRHWNEKLGHVLFFEALPNQDAAVQSLMNEACEWLRERDCAAARLSFFRAYSYRLRSMRTTVCPRAFTLTTHRTITAISRTQAL
jgi:hypothetical protein